jgi:hypothetical protein
METGCFWAASRLVKGKCGSVPKLRKVNHARMLEPIQKKTCQINYGVRNIFMKSTF